MKFGERFHAPKTMNPVDCGDFKTFSIVSPSGQNVKCAQEILLNLISGFPGCLVSALIPPRGRFLSGLTLQLFLLCHLKFETSKSFGRIAMKFGKDVHATQRGNPVNFGDPMTFPHATLGQNVQTSLSLFYHSSTIHQSSGAPEVRQLTNSTRRGCKTMSNFVCTLQSDTCTAIQP